MLRACALLLLATGCGSGPEAPLDLEKQLLILSPVEVEARCVPEPAEALPSMGTPADRLTATASGFCAVRGGGVVCWGGSWGTRPRDVPGVTGAQRVWAVGTRACAVTDAEVVCWLVEGDAWSAGGRACQLVGDRIRCVGPDGPTERLVPEPGPPVVERRPLPTEVARWGAGLVRQLAEPRSALVERATGDPAIVDAYEAVDCVCVRTEAGGLECEGRCEPVLAGAFEEARPTEGVTDVSIAGYASCLIVDGEVRCGGEAYAPEARGVRVMPEGVSPPSQLRAVGAGHCAIHERGEVSCWDRCGALEVLSGVGGPAVAVVARGDTWCALREDGGVVCRGDGARGELGNGAAAEVDAWTPIPLPGDASFAMTRDATCALTSAVTCVGRRFDDGSIQAGPFVVEGLGQPVALHASSGTLCAQSAEGHLRCAGDLAVAIRARSSGLTPSELEERSRGGGAPEGIDASPIELERLDPIDEVAVGPASVCVRSRDRVLCAGANLAYGCERTPPRCAGGLGRPDVSAVARTWLELPWRDVRALHGDGISTCASSASGAVHCWGGPHEGPWEPGAVGPGLVQRIEAGDQDIDAIRVRDGHLCVVRSHVVRCEPLGSDDAAEEVADALCASEPALCGRADAPASIEVRAGRRCRPGEDELECRGWLGRGLDGGRLGTWSEAWRRAER